jgi:monovalent cation/hydrogen antiporter
MDKFQIFLLLMSAAILIVGAAQKMRIPYPLALVLGGSLLGFFPNLHVFFFDPNLILAIVLPPILYYGAYEISFREFKQNAREIFSLALGLVVVTTLVIGIVFKRLFPDLPWALAFAFGAIISPPDAITATSILKRFNISSRLLTILEGESLINDAFALVLYKLTIVSLMTGVFSWPEASLEFFKTVIGGIIVGLAMGYALQTFSFRVLPSIVGAMFSFLVPYITYITADALGVSGVLAVVINGLILSRMVYKHHDSARHFLAITVWDVFTIFLNCFVFILIGLQMGLIFKQLTLAQTILYIGYSFFITCIMLLIRLIWINVEHVFAFLKARYRKKPLAKCDLIIREGVILGWAGMRGIVSLTAVLALPVTVSNGEHLYGRDIVIFITFFVILLTLLIPGLTLPKLLDWLKIKHVPDAEVLHLNRNKLLSLAEKEIKAIHNLTEKERKFLLGYFTTRYRILEFSSSDEKELHKLEIARRKILKAQRELLHDWEDHLKVDSKILKILELELDLEETMTVKTQLAP